jgi:hypothetical protein
MKAIQKTIYVFLFSLLILIGCKRESVTENSKNKEQVAVNGSKTSANSSNIIYKATEKAIADAKNAWLISAQSKKGNILAKGACGEHISDFIFIDQITGACNNTSWDITYFIYSYDNVGSGYQEIPVSASFTDMYFGFPISYVLLSSSSALVDPNCKAWYWDGYCEMLRTYKYKLTNVPAPSSAWPVDIGNFSLDLLSGFASNCTPVTVSGDLKGGFTAAEYALSPARVSVLPAGGPGSIYIATDCSILCPPPNIVCPTGGVLQYWPVNNPTNITTVNISSSGNFVNSIPTGATYGYSAVLNYIINGNPVSSQPQTGTFTL